MHNQVVSRDEWLNARIELLRRKRAELRSATRWRVGARSCRGSESTRLTDSTLTKGAPRSRTSSAGARSSCLSLHVRA